MGLPYGKNFIILTSTVLTDTDPPAVIETGVEDHLAELQIIGPMCIQSFFYRAMHFSAKRGIAIACRLSLRLSVCL